MPPPSPPPSPPTGPAPATPKPARATDIDTTAATAVGSGVTRRRAALIGLGSALVVGLWLVATEPYLAVVWDEGFSMGREGRIRTWFRALRDPAAFAATWHPAEPLADWVQPDGRSAPQPNQVDTASKLWERPTLEYFWPFAREEPHGHPPFYALVGLIGDLVAPGLPPLSRARLGPMLLFAAVGGALAAFLARQVGLWGALAGIGAWALQPRLFAHAHYAHYDAPLTSLWVAAILAFTCAVDRPAADPRRPRWGWAVAFGVLCGCATATKLTGWFLPLPFLVWTLLARDHRGFWTLVVGGLVAVVTLYALVPPWWGDPIQGVERFLRSNLTRAQTTLIPTLFLGQIIYTPQNSLPPYNTLVWTVAVVPAGLLGLALVGLGGELTRWWRGSRLALLVPLHWGFLLVLRALPHTPGHDGERQFLAAFGVLALLVGAGAALLVARLGRWGKALVVVALAEALAGVALLMPVPLSYYSPLVGGLPGAERLGLEPTYYWDALTDDALAWLNRNTGPGEKVVFMINPTMLNYLRDSGRLRVPGRFWEPGRPRWYVVQARTGFYNAHDRILVARHRPENVLVARLGVPLLYAFSWDDCQRAIAEAERAGPPKAP